MKRDAEQTLFVEEWLKVNELRLDVQEWLGQEPPARVDDTDKAGLLDHGLAAATVRNRDHGQRVCQTAGDFLEFDFGLGIDRGAERQRRDSKGGKGGKDETHLIPPVFHL